MTTIILTPGKFTYKDFLFVMSEKDIKFDTSYKIVNPKTGKKVNFNFSYSTGPDFKCY